MPLEITRARKRQRRITYMSFGLSIVFFVALFTFMRVTGIDKVIGTKILEIAEAIAPPPPPPPPPPDVKADVQAPPKIDMNFDVKTLLNRPTINADFDLGALNNFSADMEAPNLTMEAMEFSTNDLSNIVTNAQLPVMNLMSNIGFGDIGTVESDDAKAQISGTGKRTTGHLALAILDIPGNSEENPWTEGELETIAEYMSTNTSLKIRLGARAISFLSPYSSFDTWLNEAKQRALSEYRELPRLEPEINGLQIMANAVPYIEEGDVEEAKLRVRKLLTDYMRIKYDARFSPTDGGWAKKIEQTTPLKQFEKDYIGKAEKGFVQFYNRKEPSGKELRDIYLMFRMFEMSQLYVLFCEPRGVLDMPLPENIRLLRTYVRNGGFLYFCNTADFKESRAIVGLINALTQEKLSDPVGDKKLAELSKDDQEVSGYTFRDPEPTIGHPWIFFPMILPRTTDVSFTIYNKFGNTVFTDTIEDIGPGAYVQKKRDYKWYCVDNLGNELESGYYIYQVKADLFVKTGAVRVSVLRKLPNGRHGIFSSYYPVSEVPSTSTVKSDELSYGEPGVFGVWFKGRLAIVFTEGYKEKEPLAGDDQAAKEAALKWMTNVVIHAVSERNLAR